MDYILSDHARKRMLRRKIRAEWVAATLTDPARTENDDFDLALAQSYGSFDRIVMGTLWLRSTGGNPMADKYLVDLTEGACC